MLCNTAAVLEEGRHAGRTWQERTLRMTVLESFLVHARGLMYFLCPPRGYRKTKIKDRELFALDFCKPGWRATPWKGFSTERDNISADIMHLSLNRLEVGRNWYPDESLARIKPMFLAFLDDAERLSPHLKSEMRKIFDGQRTARADTSVAVPKPTLTGVPATGHVPTTAMIDPALEEALSRAE